MLYPRNGTALPRTRRIALSCKESRKSVRQCTHYHTAGVPCISLYTVRLRHHQHSLADAVIAVPQLAGVFYTELKLQMNLSGQNVYSSHAKIAIQRHTSDFYARRESSEVKTQICPEGGCQVLFSVAVYHSLCQTAQDSEKGFTYSTENTITSTLYYSVRNYKTV